MIEVKEIRRRDYKKAQKFAIQGMHLDWYMELNRATKVYGAYVDNIFVGVLLAEIPLTCLFYAKKISEK